MLQTLPQRNRNRNTRYGGKTIDEITEFERLCDYSLDELHRTLRYRIGTALECAYIISSPKHNDPLGYFEYKQIRKQLEKLNEQLDRIEKPQKMK